MTSKKSNDVQKKSRPKPELTPEYIAEQRALREKRKAAKRKALAAAGVVPETNQDELSNITVIKRPMLHVADATDGLKLKIMTYNVLAQSLMFKELFPENGPARKWKVRSKMLTDEIQHYNPDILCLQEADKHLSETFWAELLNGLGLEFRFATVGGKNHGNIIAFRTKLFKLVDEHFLNYDEMPTIGVPRQTETLNTGLIVELALKNSSKGVFVGTTHLFWHPKGSYERTRQMYLFMNKATSLAAIKPDHPVFLMGDFNSECFDSPYVYSTGKSLSEGTRKILSESIEHNYGNNPETWDIPNIVKALDSLFQSQSRKLISLYKSHYKDVHPTNIHPKSDGEPKFSNWAHAWRGLLDYIFVVEKQGPAVQVLDLLRMPEPEEMGEEPSGQPRVDQYPSDHLCMMANVSISQS